MIAIKGSAPSLKASQLSAVSRMLALNTDPPNQDDSASSSYSRAPPVKRYYPAGSAHNQWKIMIYDSHCRSIISPLMSVSDLRARGVTLHLLITADREQIPDVPAVYFLQPTLENISILAKDCAQGLYSRMHINFVTKLSRELMEDFAKMIIESGTGSLDRVASVHDQYLDYVCFEKGLFSLNISNSYVLYNNPTNSESFIEGEMTRIAYGLFSVVATKGVVPVIRCPRSGAPEMVARKLNHLIAEHPTLMSARKKGAMTSTQGSGTRPVLVILDRNEDLVTPVQHTSTYQALIDDVLIHKANRVEFTIEDKNEDGTKKKGKGQTKKYDLDPDVDPFYSKHKFNAFPDAIESNGVELQRVTEKESEVRSKTSASQAMQTAFVEEPGTDHLAMAVDSLPQLLEQKKQLEIHTTILQAVMNQVAARDIPTFYELESTLATGTYKNDLAKARSEVISIVKDSNKKNIQDKVRLICVYCLSTKCPSSDVDAASDALRETHKDDTELLAATELDAGIKSITYLKQLRSMQIFPMIGGDTVFSMSDAPKSANAGGDMLASFMARAQNQATGLLAKATEKVGTMLGKIHKHHLTLVVEHLCEQKPNSEDDSYLYLDPKVKGEIDVRNLRAQGVARAPVREVVAFMIGGGCYAEYQNLQMIANERRNISYGATELVDPEVFLRQLSNLS